MLGQSGAIAKRPPHPYGFYTDANDATQPVYTAIDSIVPVTATSSAIIPTSSLGLPIGGCWMTFVSDTDCYIHFGQYSGNVGAVDSNGWPMIAGVEYNWFCNEKDAYFRVIRKSADGTLKRYRSNL